MKKIVLSLAVCASVSFANEGLLDELGVSAFLSSESESILGEFGIPSKQEESMLSVDAGMWYISWNQASTASDMLKNASDAINTTYNIESSLAYVMKLNLKYKYLSWSTEYYNKASASSSADEASGLNIGISLLDYIPYINVEMKYVKADFKGGINAIRASDGATSDGSFATTLNIADIIIYPFNDYLGFGYRSYEYEVPQDLYLIDNSDGTLAGISGIDDINYKGSFYTVVLDNKRIVDVKTNDNGLVYSASYGIGKLSPTSTTNAALNKYYAESDAQYYDVLVGYAYKVKSKDSFDYGVTVGYRYNKIVTSANKASNSDNYSLITEFNTEFHGPIINLTLSY